MTEPRAIAGQAAEERALAHLEARGLTLVTRNFRCRLGEIDLVMLHRGTLVFVEVRSRKSSRFASAAESVDLRKQRKLARAAGFFLLRRRAFRHHPVRFDVVALDGPSPARYAIQWVRDAFRPGGL
ncbi:MAG TPA: YraN family protein [Woeseiaceae bacterium]|nr:YraN family protein [Woeseiaceae bacterium]